MDKSSKCAALGVLKLFETQLRTGPGGTACFLPGKEERSQDNNHDLRRNLDHVRYLIRRHWMLVLLSIKTGEDVQPRTLLNDLIAVDPDFE